LLPGVKKRPLEPKCQLFDFAPVWCIFAGRVKPACGLWGESKMLAIQTRRVEPDILVVEISGRITLGRECKELEWKTESLVREQQKKVIFDLSHVERIDSTGIGIIVMSAAQMKNSGGELRLAGATGHIEQVLKLSSIDKLVAFYPTTAEAAAGF
jgi:anti-sigma B factor antagonist